MTILDRLLGQYSSPHNPQPFHSPCTDGLSWSIVCRLENHLRMFDYQVHITCWNKPFLLQMTKIEPCTAINPEPTSYSVKRSKHQMTPSTQPADWPARKTPRMPRNQTYLCGWQQHELATPSLPNRARPLLFRNSPRRRHIRLTTTVTMGSSSSIKPAHR